MSQPAPQLNEIYEIRDGTALIRNTHFELQGRAAKDWTRERKNSEVLQLQNHEAKQQSSSLNDKNKDDRSTEKERIAFNEEPFAQLSTPIHGLMQA